jgi:hypothetical protein
MKETAMSDESSIDCDWCENEAGNTWVFVDGFVFCDSVCEGAYYSDRAYRVKNNRPPLHVERQSKPMQTNDLS